MHGVGELRLYAFVRAVSGEVRVGVEEALSEWEVLAALGIREHGAGYAVVADIFKFDVEFSVIHIFAKLVGHMLLELLLTRVVVVEAPSVEVNASSVLATELLGALDVGDLLKEGVGRGEVLSLEVGQGHTAAHLVDVVDGGLGWSVELVLTLGCTKEDI